MQLRRLLGIALVPLHSNATWDTFPGALGSVGVKSSSPEHRIQTASAQ